MVLANASNGTAVASSAPASPATGFKIVSSPGGGYTKSYVDSSGNAVADQNAGATSLYGSLAPKPAQSNGGAPTAEPAVVSSVNGKSALDQAVQQHQQTLQQMQSATAPIGPAGGKQPAPEQTKTVTATPEEIQNLKTTQQALSFDEAKASGTDLTAYNYDANSGLYMPKTSNITPQIDKMKADLADTSTKISDAFKGLLTYADNATANLISTLTQNMNDQVNAQAKINASLEAGINTENIRGGTTRYASGIAGGLLTARQEDGLTKIKVIQDQTANSIAIAQSALVDKHYTAFMDEQKVQAQLKSDTLNEIKNLQDETNKQKQYQLDIQKFQETKDQNAFDRAFRNEQEQFDQKYKMADLQLKRDQVDATFSAGNINTGITSTVSTTGNGTPSPIDQQKVYNEIAAKYGPATAGMIQKIAGYDVNPATFPTQLRKGVSGMTRSQAVQLAQQYDPSYDDKQYATRSAVLKNFTSGKYSTNINALNTGVGHLVDLTTNFAKLHNGSITPINYVENAVVSAFGSGNVVSASTNIHASTGELASVFKTGGATDTEIKNLGSINTNSSPAQAKEFIQTSIQLLASRLNALQDTYTSGMGKQPASTFLSPTNINQLSTLKNQGYTVDIPGVYYTDPIVYAKTNSANADKLASVRAEHPDLTPAQATQLAQYLQENGQ